MFCAWLQLAMGPESIFYGFFHTSWSAIQHDYLILMNKPSSRNEASRAITACITILHQHVRDIWDSRNTDLHGKDRQTQHSFKRLHLLQQIRDLYNSRHQILPGDDGAIFGRTSLEQRLSHDNQQIARWLSHALPRAHRSKRDAAATALAGQTFIHDFFHRTRPPELTWGP